MRRWSWGRRVSAVLVGAVAGLAVAGVAFAHVEVEAEPATGGATNAKVTFSAEAESQTAGIKSVQIVLPSSIPPASVTLASGPAGWTLTPNADGYTVAGAALPKGQDAVHAVTIATLPNVQQLVFKALVTYSNGDVDRWIEEPSTANPNPQNPAPILKLTPGPTTAPPTTTAAATTATITATTTQAAAPASDDSGLVWIWVLIILVVLAVAITLALVLARRRRTG